MKIHARILSGLGTIALMAMTLSFSTAAYAIAGKFQFVNGEVQVIDTSGAQHVVKNIGADDATARFSLTTKFINGGYESSR